MKSVTFLILSWFLHLVWHGFILYSCYFPRVLVQQITIMCVFIHRDNKSDLFRTFNYQYCMWYFRKIIPFQIFFFFNRELESRACSSNRTWKLFGEQNCLARSSSSRNNFPSMEGDLIHIYKNKYLLLPLSFIIYLKWRWLFKIHFCLQ